MSSLVINDLGRSRPAARPVKKAGRWLLAMIAFFVAAAAFPGLRIELGSLQVPLHVVPLLLAVPSALPRFARVPAAVRGALLAFTLLFTLSVLSYGSEFGDLIKMVTSVITLLTVASLIRNKTDFIVGAVAFALALLIINSRGILGGVRSNVGYEPLKGIANKNAYSIYALPAVMISGFVLLHFQQSKWVKGVLAASILSSSFILFSGANRSGWGGIVLIGGLLAVQARRWRALAGVGALALASYGIFAWFGSRDIFEYRLEQTSSGYGSDDLRQSLFLSALEIGLENPLLGISVQQLPRELAKRTASDGDAVDPHNFIGYIAGGAGLICLLALFALGIALWRRPPIVLTRNVRLAHDLVRMLLVLFVFRGFFTREIFTVAAFPIAFGLALGLALVDDDDESWDLVSDPKR